MWQNLKNYQFQKLRLRQSQNCKETQKLKLWKNIIFVTLFCRIFFVTQFLWHFRRKNKWIHWQPRGVFRAAFCDTYNVSFLKVVNKHGSRFFKALCHFWMECFVKEVFWAVQSLKLFQSHMVPYFFFCLSSFSMIGEIVLPKKFSK